jgi:hypothetical protein
VSVTRLSIAACAAALAMAALPAQALVHGSYHIFPTKSYLEKQSKEGRWVTPSGQMNYYGGSVLANVKLVSVMWNKDVNPTTSQAIPGFSAAIVNSNYVDQMSEYNTKGVKAINGHRGTKQVIGRGTYLGQVVLVPKNKSTSLTDDDVQAELRHQIKIGALPPQDLDTLYMVYFPDGITITLDGLVSCQSFGAYHFATNDLKLSRNNLFYSVEPSCHYSLTNITFAASHEYAEATTDNVPTPGSFPDFPQAWNDADGFEIGDKCGGSGQLTAGASHWTVTQYYLNTKSGCSTGNYTSP